MNKTLLIAILAMYYSSLSSLAQPKTFDVTIPPGKNYDKASFRLWYHEASKPLRGIIVLTPGSNSDGRTMAEDPFWQNVARTSNFAIVSCRFTDHPGGTDPDIEKYVNAKEGSGDALLRGLNQFGTLSSHSELATAPLFLWGFSAGGEFNYEFVCWNPSRVMAFVVNKGGVFYSAIASKEARKVPGLFFIGANDLEGRNEIIKGIFSMNRRFGARWAFASELGTAHEIGRSPKLSQTFFSEVLELRLGPNSKVKDILESKGVLGDNSKLTYLTFYQWTDNKTTASWLPTSKFAEAWVSFLKQRS